MEGKNIKVYGTLINHTLNTDASMRDSQHNDLIAVAYQLFDERFNPKKGSGANGAVINIDRYQDIINKRLTALSYDPNGDLTSLYSNLYVSGDTNIGGDLTVEGNTTFEGDVNITGRANLTISLNDLSDVTLSTMTVGQVLRYDGSKWVNSKISLSDILMPSASAGQVLKFNGTDWVADTDSDTKDIDSILPAASEGLVLKYTNGHWVPGTDLTGSSGVSTLEDLTDVDTTNKSNGDVLTYDSNSGKWKATTSSSAGITMFEVDVTNTYATYSTGDSKIYYYLMSKLDAKKVINVAVEILYTHDNALNMNNGSLILILHTLTWSDKNMSTNVQNLPDNCWYSNGISNSYGTTANSVKFIFYMLN